MTAAGLPTWEDYQPGNPDVCVWCHVTGCLGWPDNPPTHLPVCPSVTGMWPVQPHHVDRNTCCALCGHVFVLGEYSAEVTDPLDPQWSLTFCQPCALLRHDDAVTEVHRVRPPGI